MSVGLAHAVATLLAAASAAGVAWVLASGVRIRTGWQNGTSPLARWLDARRRAAFNAQLPEALATMSNALRAGFSISQAFDSVVDQGERLRARQDEDYRLIDAACRVLYGADNRSGLYALVGWPADAIYHHYLALRTWEETAALLGYSVRHVQTCVRAALDLADANGQMWTELGRGMAE